MAAKLRKYMSLNVSLNQFNLYNIIYFIGPYERCWARRLHQVAQNMRAGFVIGRQIFCARINYRSKFLTKRLRHSD